jgi:hypothetical protein
MIPLIFIGTIAAVIVGAFVLKAYRVFKAKNLLARLWIIDNSWDADELKYMADNVRTRVLHALDNGNVDLVRGLMTERLYDRLKGKTAKQFGFRKADWLTTVISTSKNIIDVVDYKDDTRDRLGFHVSFFCLSLGRGGSGLPDEFWVFVRKDDGWIVSDIDPNAGIRDLASCRAYSEALTISDNIAKMEAAGKAAPVQVSAEEVREEHVGRKEYKTGRKEYH